jgi:prostaglandin-endoperoxide synthase 2
MTRDTSRDGLGNTLQYWALAHFPRLWSWVNRRGWLSRRVNRFLINNLVTKTRSRPHPLSTLSPYSSWESLTDRTYFGRHLPPKRWGPLPKAADVARLFRRPDSGPRLSDKSTMLFASFAQWFTDGILLTADSNRRRTTTNHEIDFSPLYGLRKAVTDCLRLRSERRGQRGRLKSQMINGEEYSPFLFQDDGRTVRPEFADAPLPLRLPAEWPVDRRVTLFAFGGERTNSTPQTAMLNTLFLREHNRVCGELEEAHGDWDDERVFQTARNVVIVLLIKVVVEEYINHISPYYFRFRADPAAAWDAPWNKTSWFTVEFNLLYRWHSLIPDNIVWAGQKYAGAEWVFNNAPLLQHGLAAAFDSTSRQKAGEIGLFNTPQFLLPTEAASIEQGRENELAGYNDYREAMGFPRVTDFTQISGDDAVVAGLKSLYKTVDDVEFYVGLFAEDRRPRAVVPNLIGRMVGIDAFSQALTNPLLSRYLFLPATFSQAGMRVIEGTGSLADLIYRNVPGADPSNCTVSMTQTEPRPGPHA